MTPRALGDLVLGSVVGTPFGVWALATLPVSGLNRLIGLMLLVAVALELRGVMPRRLVGRAWGLAPASCPASSAAPSAPRDLPCDRHATTQGWSPRTMKANVMGFFVVNQGAILIAYWWAGLLTREALTLAAAFALPPWPASGPASRSSRLDPVRFRRMIFGLLLISGLILLVRGTHAHRTGRTLTR